MVAKSTNNKLQYPISGFPFGLNTATDEALLDAKYSPNMLNVYVSDSDAIVRRRGYTPVLDAALGNGQPIRSIYRFYRQDGHKYSLYVSGTHLYSQFISATSYTPSAPKQILTMNTKTYYGATVVALDTPNNTKLSLEASGLNNYRTRTRNVYGLMTADSQGRIGKMSMRFFDFADSNTNEQLVGLSQHLGTSGAETILAYVGVRPGTSTSNYTMLTRNGTTNTTVETSVPRTTGWHTVEFYFRVGLNEHVSLYSILVDGVSIGGSTKLPTASDGVYTTGVHIFALSRSLINDAVKRNRYFDEFRMNNVLIDDFATLNMTDWGQIDGLTHYGTDSIQSGGSQFRPIRDFNSYDGRYVNNNALIVERTNVLATTVTITATVPPCTNLSVKVPSKYYQAKINSQPWENVNNAPVWSPMYGINNDAENTISFRQRGSNGKSLLLDSSAQGSWISAYQTVSDTDIKEFSFYFYDGVGGAGEGDSFFGLINSGRDFEIGMNNGMAGIFTYGTPSPGAENYHLCFYDFIVDIGSIAGVAITDSYNRTTIPRTLGWHYAKIVLGVPSGGKTPTSIYIDDVLAGSRNVETAGFRTFIAATGKPTGQHIDMPCVDGVCINQYDDTNALSTFSWGSSSARTVSTSTAKYVTEQLPLVLDEIVYSFSNTATTINKVSATAENFAFTTMNDLVYFSNEFTGLKKTNGATVATVSGAFAGGFLIENKNRIFQAGSDSDKTGLLYSMVGNPEDWTVAHDAGEHRVVASSGNSVCTGLAVMNKEVIYFAHSRAASLRTDGVTSGWNSVDISTTNGCIAPKSIAAGARGIVFLSADGVRAYGPLQSIFSNDGTGFSILSKNIAGLNRTTTESSSSSNAFPAKFGYSDVERSEAVGAYYDNKYWLFIGTDCYVADMMRQTDNKQPIWTLYRFSGMDTPETRVRSASVMRGDEYGLIVGTQNGMVYRIDNGNNDGFTANESNPINWHYETPFIPMGGYTNIKHFRNVQVGSNVVLPYIVPDESRHIYTQQFGLDIFTDEMARVSPTQTVTATLSTDIRPTRVPISSSGRAIKIRVHATTSGEPVELPYVVFEYGKPRAR